MDLEELTKSQIVLLTLLVSFVTSIATGIVTVSLMDQAPPTVTQTINRVVERTVERAAPESQAANVVTRERTVVVKESELIAQAVSRISPSVVAVHEIGNANATSTESTGEASTQQDEETMQTGTFLARGAIIAPGAVAVVSDPMAEDDAYAIRFEDGGVGRAQVIFKSDVNNVAILTFNEETYSIDPAAFVTSLPKLGQSVVGLTGENAVQVSNGLVTAFVDETQTSESETPDGNTQTRSFETNISGSSLVPGSVIINTDGAVLGLSRGASSRIIPSTVVLDTLAQLNDIQDNANTTEGGTE